MPLSMSGYDDPLTGGFNGIANKDFASISGPGTDPLLQGVYAPAVDTLGGSTATASAGAGASSGLGGMNPMMLSMLLGGVNGMSSKPKGQMVDLGYGYKAYMKTPLSDKMTSMLSGAAQSGLNTSLQMAIQNQQQQANFSDYMKKSDIEGQKAKEMAKLNSELTGNRENAIETLRNTHANDLEKSRQDFERYKMFNDDILKYSESDIKDKQFEDTLKQRSEEFENTLKQHRQDSDDRFLIDAERNSIADRQLTNNEKNQQSKSKLSRYDQFIKAHSTALKAGAPDSKEYKSVFESEMSRMIDDPPSGPGPVSRYIMFPKSE